MRPDGNGKRNNIGAIGRPFRLQEMAGAETLRCRAADTHVFDRSLVFSVLRRLLPDPDGPLTLLQAFGKRAEQGPMFPTGPAVVYTANAPGSRRHDCIRIGGCGTMPIVMDVESSY